MELLLVSVSLGQSRVLKLSRYKHRKRSVAVASLSMGHSCTMRVYLNGLSLRILALLCVRALVFSKHSNL